MDNCTPVMRSATWLLQWPMVPAFCWLHLASLSYCTLHKCRLEHACMTRATIIKHQLPEVTRIHFHSCCQQPAQVAQCHDVRANFHGFSAWGHDTLMSMVFPLLAHALLCSPNYKHPYNFQVQQHEHSFGEVFESLESRQQSRP